MHLKDNCSSEELAFLFQSLIPSTHLSDSEPSVNSRESHALSWPLDPALKCTAHTQGHTCIIIFISYIFAIIIQILHFPFLTPDYPIHMPFLSLFN